MKVFPKPRATKHRLTFLPQRSNQIWRILPRRSQKDRTAGCFTETQEEQPSRWRSDKTTESPSFRPASLGESIPEYHGHGPSLARGVMIPRRSLTTDMFLEGQRNSVEWSGW